MRSYLTTIVLAAAAIFAGCSETAPRAAQRTSPPPLLVPSAAIIQRPSRPLPALASNALPASDSAYYFPRGEKAVYGSYSLGNMSAYTLFRFDAQRIDEGFGSVGYQYRWVVQQGAATPPPP